VSRSLEGKSIVVTGGSMGIGYAVARRCLEDGARATVFARRTSELEAAAGRLRAGGYDDCVEWIAGDVSAKADVERLFERAAARFGGVDGVVHCAAVIEPIGAILDVDPQAWLRTVEIDLYGTFLVTRQACASMRDRGGRIVLFSGGGASAAYPNFTAYGCSKAAVVRFAETVAIEMHPHGIEINALAPGLVATRMGEIARRSGVAGASAAPAAVKPDVAARAAAFLLSDAARGITGKFVSAVHDEYARWPEHLGEMQGTDLFTLRRILPRERGMQWQ
jgi:NAD(P)-dependent dehydrogenase (short-subunit alcohol dehydrogenase family)